MWMHSHRVKSGERETVYHIVGNFEWVQILVLFMSWPASAKIKTGKNWWCHYVGYKHVYVGTNICVNKRGLYCPSASWRFILFVCPLEVYTVHLPPGGLYCSFAPWRFILSVCLLEVYTVRLTPGGFSVNFAPSQIFYNYSTLSGTKQRSEGTPTRERGGWLGWG